MEAKEAGKIGHIGLTAHSVEVFEKALTLPWVETIMFPYNIVESQGEELIKKCTELNVGFIAMKPLAGGAIEDGNLAIRYICSNPDVTVVIPGMYDLKEIDQNLAAAENTAPLTEEEKVRTAQIKETVEKSREALRAGQKCRKLRISWAVTSAAAVTTAHRVLLASTSPAYSYSRAT